MAIEYYLSAIFENCIDNKISKILKIILEIAIIKLPVFQELEWQLKSIKHETQYLRSTLEEVSVPST